MLYNFDAEMTCFVEILMCIFPVPNVRIECAVQELFFLDFWGDEGENKGEKTYWVVQKQITTPLF